jgi:hypothetical protein
MERDWNQTRKSSFNLFVDESGRTLMANSWAKHHGGLKTRHEKVERDFDIVYVRNSALEKYTQAGVCTQLPVDTRGNRIIYSMRKNKHLAYDATTSN